MADWPVETHDLDPPSLEHLAQTLTLHLRTHFPHASATVVPCPDLHEPPFHLATQGLSGSPRIADVGGPPNLHPHPTLTKRYDLLDIARLIDLPANQGSLIGASAGDWEFVGQNSELVPNMAWSTSSENRRDVVRATNRTRIAQIQADGVTAVCSEDYDHTGFGLMGNFFGSLGLPGPVLKITASAPSGGHNLPAAVQAALRAGYGDRPISLGGVLVLQKGTAKTHVMPDFCSEPLDTDAKTHEWLKFFEVEAPVICLSVLHSNDPGLALRMEHTHCFRTPESGGGHYHGDVGDGDVMYEGFFQVAEAVYRVDRSAGS